MEELEYMLKHITKNQASLSQVVLSSDQFGLLNDLISAVMDVTRETSESNVSLHKKLRASTMENEDLRKDLDLMNITMKKWQDSLLEHMEQVKNDIETESDIAKRWMKEVRKEKDKNEFLESTLKDYSSKVAALRAEVGIVNIQILKVQEEKSLLSENFKRSEHSHDNMREKYRGFRDKYEREVQQRMKDQVNWELESKSLKKQHAQEVSKHQEETEDLKQRLKETVDFLNKHKDDRDTKNKTDVLVCEELKSSKEELKVLKKTLENLEKTNKQLQTQNSKLSDEVNEKPISLSSKIGKIGSNQQTINKLHATIEKLKDELEAAKSSLIKTNDKLDNQLNDNKSKATDKSSTDTDLAKSHKLLVDILKNGTTTKYKDKSLLLASLLKLDDANIPKIKKNYIDLLDAALEHTANISNKSRKTDKSVKNARGMDIEHKSKPASRSSRELNRKNMTPERNMVGMSNEAQELDPLDTAMKKLFCNHSIYDPNCASCDVRKASKQSGLVIKQKKQKQGSINFDN